MEQQDNQPSEVNSTPPAPAPQPEQLVPRVESHSKKRVVAAVIAVLLLILGATFYLLANNGDKSDSSQLSSESESQDQAKKSLDTEEQSSEQVSESDGSVQEATYYTKYTDGKYGFTFSYPEEWGDVDVVDGPEANHLVSGADKQITFSGNRHVTAGFKTNDWKHDESGHDGIAYPGFVDFATTKKNVGAYTEQKNIYTDDNGAFAYVSICNEFCTQDYPKTLLIYDVKIKNEMVDGIEFYSYGDILGEEYKDGKPLEWNQDKINKATASVIFPKSDFRFIVLDKVAKSVK